MHSEVCMISLPIRDLVLLLLTEHMNGRRFTRTT